VASHRPAARPSGLGGLRWNFVTAALPVVGSFLVSIFLAPYLGAALWGRYSLVMTAATMWLILAKFGIHAATGRLVAEHPDDEGRWIRAGLRLRLASTGVIALIASACALPLARTFGISDGVGTFLWIAPVVLAASLFEFATEVLVGLSSFRRLLVARATFLALRLAGVALVVMGGHGVATFLGAHSLAQLIPTIALLVWVLRRYRSGVESLSPALRRTWELSVPLAFGSASFLIFSHTDRLMLGWFRDEATVGQFSVARNVLDAAIFPMSALAWSLRPALVRAVAVPEHFNRELRRGLRLAAIFSVLAPLALGLVAPRLLVQDWLYGREYSSAAGLLAWMTPILFLRSVGVVIFPALLALDDQGHYARLMIATALLNIVANLAAIPKFGAKGAVLATILALAFLTAAGFARIHRRGGFFLTPH
jgi:O-antigen/teichoic acid export membrane protein